jgi:hypothetical protein
MHTQFSALPVKILGLIADFSSASKTHFESPLRNGGR